MVLLKTVMISSFGRDTRQTVNKNSKKAPKWLLQQLAAPPEVEKKIPGTVVYFHLRSPCSLVFLSHQLAEDDPKAKSQKYKVLYRMDSLPTPIDSSNVTPKDWSDMAERIKEHMCVYDGFVIIHGTDTMAYTSSALSFILGKIYKPVIVTGAQMPIFHPRTDGLDNFVGSMLMAGYFCDREMLHQVMLYDLNKLYQGNRVVKFDCDSFSVFDSPDVFPIAIYKHKMVEPIFPPSLKSKAFTRTETPQVRILRFFPGITENYVNTLNLYLPNVHLLCFLPAVQVRGILVGADGVILETYGSGNVPDVAWLKECLTEADKRGVLMLNCTQVYRGTVLPIYATFEVPLNTVPHSKGRVLPSETFLQLSREVVGDVK
uniref:asparaginase n=1 Tax=Pygocentrus nattereri TaxID=42514 RepID=A0AAR2M6D0_PYGNA